MTTPDELAGAGGERELLEAFLDEYRRVVVSKARGLTDEQARGRLVPSMTTLAGMVRHLTGVERHWFQAVLAQVPRETLPPNNRGLPDSWVVEDGETLDWLIAEYEEACEGSRAAAARFPLEHAVPHHRLGTVSLRWIYLHMLEETARHAGHADILRELTDGETGFGG